MACVEGEALDEAVRRPMCLQRAVSVIREYLISLTRRVLCFLGVVTHSSSLYVMCASSGGLATAYIT